MNIIKRISKSQHIKMGSTTVKQPLPASGLEQVSPFLLLHHFGPSKVSPGSDPLGVGPHPHRGFEPVTFLYQGGIRHKDSMGNEGILEGGDVQWMTAGKGVIHSERASKEFLENGGTMEGIQLWVNLPKSSKMVPAKYQDIKSATIPVLKTDEEGVKVKVVAGKYGNVEGPANTHTPILALQIEMETGTKFGVDVPKEFQAMAYVLDGEINFVDGEVVERQSLAVFNEDVEKIHLHAKEKSRILFLAAIPILEPVAQWGPYVMNTQTELLQAMRDYQMGKMGVYID